MITFIGHITRDINIDVIVGKEKIEAGGGVLYGSVVASLLGVESTVVTKCARGDIDFFESLLREAGVKAFFLESVDTTTIRNEYYSSNPDSRESYLIRKAEPFTKEDLSFVPDCNVIHVNPLWYGEFKEEYIPLLRGKARFLSADAQGFLRRVEENGKMVYKEWPKEECLPFLDLLKVDAKEAKSMTGESDLRKACEIICSLGPRYVIVTHTDGVIVFSEGQYHEAQFEGWTLKGRTGRGDTCTAAFLVAFLFKGMNMKSATEFSAKVTSLKMRHPGPLRREDIEALTSGRYI